MAGRPEGGATEYKGSILEPGIIINLLDGHFALPIALPFGSVEATSLIAIAEKAHQTGVSDLRLAPGRKLLALCPSREAADALRKAAAGLGFITAPSDPRAQIAACPGQPACASGHIPARPIGEAVAREFGDLLQGDMFLHISGCAKGCARQAQAAITIVGDEKGAGLVVGGTARNTASAYIPARDAASGLAHLADFIRLHRLPGEELTSTLNRLGPVRVAAAYTQGTS